MSNTFAPAVATDLVPSEPAGAFLSSALPVIYPDAYDDDTQRAFALAVDAVRLAVSLQMAAEPGRSAAAVTADLVASVIENMFDVCPEVAI